MSAADSKHKDNRFGNRVQSAIQTAQAWDDDPLLLAECRCIVSFAEISDDHGAYAEPQDMLYSKNHRFLRRLARYFKRDVMTWVNQPACQQCGNKTTESQGTRGPETLEEREGAASRVEVYLCTSCNATINFPRYNSCRKLIETRQGRCGEYANLFGLYLRACGLETRYISDWTDHVWNEVYLDGRWLMIDSCEGVVDEPSMYEAGWGKQLDMIVGAAKDHVIDVTPRYTRQFQQAHFQARRREIVSLEQRSQAIIDKCNGMLRRDMERNVRKDVAHRLDREEQQLQELKAKTSWEKEYHQGRISGSLTWKLRRHEAGMGDRLHPLTNEDEGVGQYELEAFYPPTFKSRATILVDPNPKTPHHAIVVSGAACAIGRANSLSVVVVDEDYLGCILQSRSFSSLQSFADFVELIPTSRIVAIHGLLPNVVAADIDEMVKTKVMRLGGFRIECVAKGVLFIGQVKAVPCSWTVSASYADAPQGRLLQSIPVEHKELKLAQFSGTRPASVVGRLPDSYMPHPSQLKATTVEKKNAFEEFIYDHANQALYSGFTTRDGTCVYLLDSTAFPFDSLAMHKNSWTTFLLLPPPAVPQDEAAAKKSQVSFEVPVNVDFFTETVGSQLLTKANGMAPTDTACALSGARLVAFYFSAHWCGPCRSFTPMLAEMYLHLREVYPSHGLEIVFVSSDRDQQSFQSYFASMPWLAIPFASLSAYKPILSAVYGVQGIPSFVVLDSLTGSIVSDASSARGEVVQACRLGEDGIARVFNTWLDRVPVATKDMVQMLELSCDDDALPIGDEIVAHAGSYFRRNTTDSSITSEMEHAVSIRSNFLFSESSHQKVEETAPASIVDGMLADGRGRDAVKEAIETTLAYLENAAKSPCNPKFRSFKLSNKIADRVSRTKEGLHLLRSLGFDIVALESDFYATIIMGTDLDAAVRRTKGLLEKLAETRRFPAKDS